MKGLGGAMNKKRFCVYTSLIGNYEKLNEQPVALRSDVDFICLTDDAELKSNTWKIIRVDPTFKKDPFRSHRIIKLSPHEFLPDYDISFYIDNSVILIVKPEDIFEHYGQHCDFLLPTHSFRETVLAEFSEVKRLGLADPRRISEQLAHYKATDEDCLYERPYWGGMLIRRHSNQAVRAAMRIWLYHVLRYGRRDQLSANYAFRQVDIAPYRLEIGNYSSWFHTWPVSIGRRQNMRVARSPILGRVLAGFGA
jgi:hypothetical protein